MNGNIETITTQISAYLNATPVKIRDGYVLTQIEFREITLSYSNDSDTLDVISRFGTSRLRRIDVAHNLMERGSLPTTSSIDSEMVGFVRSIIDKVRNREFIPGTMGSAHAGRIKW
jgi:hypothetical protein